MGVIYKFKPEIRDFIIKQKEINSILSCRKLAGLVNDKFQIKLSKSQINSIIKAKGLSSPVGRRPKPKRKKIIAEFDGLGAFLLKAADYLVGGSYLFTEAIKQRYNAQIPDILAKTESLLYLPLFSPVANTQLKPDCGLWQLVGKRFTQETINTYLNELQRVKTLPLDIFRIISSLFQEVRCVKVGLASGATFYLDGQLYTVWSTPYIPYDFSTTTYNIKSYINKYFQENTPFILFMAAGYDMPTKEFFDFIMTLNSTENQITGFTLCGNNLEELEVVRVGRSRRHFFIFGLWPWQFMGQYRQAKIMGEYRQFYFEALKQNFYLAEAEVELSQPNVNKRFTLRGCAVKINLNEKARLVILTNLPAQETSLEDLTRAYLNHWPNLEECFQDYSRKIELFTYTASSQRVLSTESLGLNMAPEQGPEALFNYYLRALDLYVRWHFLPSGLEDCDYLTIKERFYSLKARLKQQKEAILVAFQVPPGYSFLKELKYACRRVNEREIVFSQDKRLWLSV